MVVDTVALGRLSAKWTADAFRSRYANIVGGWCASHFESFGKAPGKNIEGLFETWAAKTRDKDTVELVEKFLTGLSEAYEDKAAETNSAYIVDLAVTHFTLIKLQRTLREVEAELNEGNLNGAVERVTQFNAVKMGGKAAIDVLNDKEAIRAAFEDAEEDIVSYPGALGTFFKGQLVSDGFVCFMAPEKRGKSFWLVDIGWRAMLQRRKVAWFAAGDMSERQMLRRFGARAARAPVKAKHWPLDVRYPLRMRRREDGTIQVKHEIRTFERPLDWRTAWKAFQEVAQYRVRGKEPYLRLACYPNSTLSVKQIDAQLREWEKENWVPQVVIVDYADILDEAAAAPKAATMRERINASWMMQRQLSQTWHSLYVTATQADAEGGSVELLRRSNFSEDKRKLAHVTGMCGINQTEIEKELGVYRLNWIVLREGEFAEGATVATATCLPFANPCVRSCF